MHVMLMPFVTQSGITEFAQATMWRSCGVHHRPAAVSLRLRTTSLRAREFYHPNGTTSLQSSCG